MLTIDAGKSEFGEFLAFETLTLCPIDVRCIDVTLLEAREPRVRGESCALREKWTPEHRPAMLEARKAYAKAAAKRMG